MNSISKGAAVTLIRKGNASLPKLHLVCEGAVIASGQASLAGGTLRVEWPSPVVLEAGKSYRLAIGERPSHPWET